MGARSPSRRAPLGRTDPSTDVCNRLLEDQDVFGDPTEPTFKDSTTAWLVQRKVYTPSPVSQQPLEESAQQGIDKAIIGQSVYPNDIVNINESNSG
jgi:hypothetical protein